MGGLNRGRQQSLMDLNYQNFLGQYNLPMQTLQNVGSLVGALGPLAGGYGYAGGNPATNPNYYPNQGYIGNPYAPPVPGTTPPPGTTPGGGYTPYNPNVAQYANGGRIGLPGLYNRYKR
jgi:hypothetical protein